MAIDLNKLKPEDRKDIADLVKTLEYHGLKVERKGSAEQGKKYEDVDLLATGSPQARTNFLRELRNNTTYVISREFEDRGSYVDTMIDYRVQLFGDGSDIDLCFVDKKRKSVKKFS